MFKSQFKCHFTHKIITQRLPIEPCYMPRPVLNKRCRTMNRAPQNTYSLIGKIMSHKMKSVLGGHQRKWVPDGNEHRVPEAKLVGDWDWRFPGTLTFKEINQRTLHILSYHKTSITGKAQREDQNKNSKVLRTPWIVFLLWRANMVYFLQQCYAQRAHQSPNDCAGEIIS